MHSLSAELARQVTFGVLAASVGLRQDSISEAITENWVLTRDSTWKTLPQPTKVKEEIDCKHPWAGDHLAEIAGRGQAPVHS